MGVLRENILRAINKLLVISSQAQWRPSLRSLRIDTVRALAWCPSSKTRSWSSASAITNFFMVHEISAKMLKQWAGTASIASYCSFMPRPRCIFITEPLTIDRSGGRRRSLRVRKGHFQRTGAQITMRFLCLIEWALFYASSIDLRAAFRDHLENISSRTDCFPNEHDWNLILFARCVNLFFLERSLQVNQLPSILLLWPRFAH